jgi:hypothetical protein
VTSHTSEQEFALKRQLFLTEQGYHYGVVDLDTPEDVEALLDGVAPQNPARWAGS